MKLTAKHEKLLREVKKLIEPILVDTLTVEVVLSDLSYAEEDAEAMIEFINDPEADANAGSILELAYNILQYRDPENA